MSSSVQPWKPRISGMAASAYFPRSTGGSGDRRIRRRQADLDYIASSRSAYACVHEKVCSPISPGKEGLGRSSVGTVLAAQETWFGSLTPLISRQVSQHIPVTPMLGTWGLVMKSSQMLSSGCTEKPVSTKYSKEWFKKIPDITSDLNICIALRIKNPKSPWRASI